MNPDATLMDGIGSLCRENNIPYSALVELTGKCNLKCFHCYNQPDSGRELSTPQILNILEQLAELGCLYLTFSGGEPLCRSDHLEIFQKARNLNFAWNLFTNAALITPEKARQTAELNILEASVTVFSTDHAVHDDITGVAGSLQKTLQGLEHLKNAGVRLKIRCILTKKNLKGYRKVLELARQLEASCQFDTNLLPAAGGDMSVFKQRLEEKELRQVLSDPDVFPVPGDPLSVEHVRCVAEKTSLQLTCSAGITYVCINAYGDVYPCIHYLESGGSVKQQSLKTIWESSPVFTRARSVSVESLKECKECPHASYCARCAALAHREDGDLLGPSTWACQTAKVAREVFQKKS